MSTQINFPDESASSRKSVGVSTDVIYLDVGKFPVVSNVAQMEMVPQKIIYPSMKAESPELEAESPELEAESPEIEHHSTGFNASRDGEKPSLVLTNLPKNTKETSCSPKSGSSSCDRGKASSIGSKERLYPSLVDLDDHSEVFGPRDFHPDVIAAKVKTLVRVSPEKSAEKILPINPQISEKILSFKSDVNRNSCENIHESLQRTKIEVTPSEVRVCGESIKSEVEDGKKVIFILGEEDEDLESRKSSSESSFVAKVVNHPVDTRPVVEARHVARAAPDSDTWNQNIAR